LRVPEVTAQAVINESETMMKRSLLWPLACLVIAAASAEAQPAQPAGDSELQLCLAGAADYSPVYPTRVFPAGTTHEVTAVVRLGKGESYKKLDASWMVVDVGKAAPAHQVISKVTLPVRGDRGAIHMRSGPGANHLGGIGTQALETDAGSTFLTKLGEDSIRDASRRANDYLIAQPGDWVGAGKIYNNNAGVIPDTGIRIPSIQPGTIRKGAYWAGVIISIYDHVQNTRDLANSYAARHDANQEAKQVQAEIDKVDAKVEEVLKQIAELRERCEPCEKKNHKRDETGQCKDPCSPTFKWPPCPSGNPLCHGVGQCR
jgi:hypothetical protein